MTAQAIRSVFDSSAQAAAGALSDPITNAAATAHPDQAFQLERTDTRHGSEMSLAEQGASALPPVDKGKGALTFLAAAFFLELVLWGYLGAFGVIQLYLSTHAPFSSSSLASIGAVGTVALGLYLMLPFVSVLLARRYPHLVRRSVWIALGVNVVAMAASSFASDVVTLIVLQGLVCGVSGSVLYLPALLYLPEWYVARRGTASGIVFAGTGLGGAVFPYLISALLQRVGFAWTTRIWALVTLVTLGPAAYVIRPRLPVVRPTADAPYAPLDLGFLLHRSSAPMLSCAFLAGLSWYPVSTLIPTYVSATGASVASSNTVLSVLNIANTVAGLGFGALSDRVGYAYLFLFIGTAEGLLAAASWGTASSLGAIFAFVVLFGLFNGQTATWNSCARDLTRDDPQQANLVFSSMSVARGLACVIGPIVSNSLYDPSKANDASHWGRFGFGSVMVWVTVTALASGAAGLALGLVVPSGRKAQHKL